MASSPRMPLTGRRPVTPEELASRIEAYCARYGASLTPEGLPSFPTGRRETDQHREWLSLYKANDRLRRRAVVASGVPCPVCLAQDGSHADCRTLLKVARALGPEALERVRRQLWP
jgi:hypothetical protein